MNKYHNSRFTVNGKTFDSKKEAKRYSELVDLAGHGVITDFKTQVKFELIPKQDGKRACSYIADFVYRDAENNLVVEDVKGSKKTLSDSYKIKKKLMLNVHETRITQAPKKIDKRIKLPENVHNKLPKRDSKKRIL